MPQQEKEVINLAAKKGHYCEKCHQTLSETNFYKSNNLEKYPDDGMLNQCKKCITMHVDNWNPDTYTWILKECDVPYIPEKWSSLLAKWGRDASKITGTTILGRYLSSMRIKPYSDYRWKDTQFLQEMADAKQEEAMKRSGYNAAQIAQALEMGRIDMPPRPDPIISEPQPPVGYNDEPDEEMQQMIASLTDEDRKYLRLKWGKSYRPDEWI